MDFVQRNRITSTPLDKPIPMKTADDSESLVKGYTYLTMEFKDSTRQQHQEKIKMYIANIGQQDVILGTGWLIRHNPEINWTTYDLKMTRCPKECQGSATKKFPKKARIFKLRCTEDEEETNELLKQWTTDEVHT
jgi:hypothetical protein